MLAHPLKSDRRSMFLLVSIVAFYILAPLIEKSEVGELLLILNLYATLTIATMELQERPVLFFSAIPLAAASMVLLLTSHYFPTRPLLIANGAVLATFIALVSVSLFTYLGRQGQITSGRLYVSVALYFLLGMGWYAIYDFLSVLNPGSFAENGALITAKTGVSEILYFSLCTLTTVGYGDVIPMHPAARMLAALEAAAGVLYIAITVARLVAAYQSPVGEKQNSQ